MTVAAPLIRPFVAERFARRNDLSSLISPPYDVISPAERSALASRSAANIVHLIVPEGPGDRYEHAAHLLDAWRRDGTLERDAGPTVSILRQQFTTTDGVACARTGLIAAVCAEPYARGRVRPHERTHAGPKEDRLRLVRATRTVLEPLLFLSRDSNGGLDALLRRETSRVADIEAILDQVGISLWIVPAARAMTTLESLRSQPLYVADGHHRYETAAAYALEQPGSDWTMGVIVGTGDPGLVVLPTHRALVGGHADRSALERVVAAAAESTGSANSDCLIVWPDGSRVPVRLRRDGGPEVPLVSLIERVLVAPLLATSSGGRLIYAHDERSLTARCDVAVLLHPTPVEDVLGVADAGGTMPPKSTFFYPKVPSGVVLGPLG